MRGSARALRGRPFRRRPVRQRKPPRRAGWAGWAGPRIAGLPMPASGLPPASAASRYGTFFPLGRPANGSPERDASCRTGCAGVVCSVMRPAGCEVEPNGITGSKRSWWTATMARRAPAFAWSAARPAPGGIRAARPFGTSTTRGTVVAGPSFTVRMQIIECPPPRFFDMTVTRQDRRRLPAPGRPTANDGTVVPECRVERAATAHLEPSCASKRLPR